FESGMVTSYSDTNPPIARRVTTPFNRIDCASRIRRRSPSNYGYRRNSKGERAWVQASVLNRLLVLDEREAPAPPDEREGDRICDCADDRAPDERPHHVRHEQWAQQPRELIPELIAAERELEERHQPVLKIGRQAHARDRRT